MFHIQTMFFLQGTSNKIRFLKKSSVSIKSKFCVSSSKIAFNSEFSTIEGHIIDRLSGEGIIASIFLKQLDDGVQSDSTGWFSMSVEKQNKLIIEISGVGYDDLILDHLDFREDQFELLVLLGTTIVK